MIPAIPLALVRLTADFPAPGVLPGDPPAGDDSGAEFASLTLDLKIAPIEGDHQLPDEEDALPATGPALVIAPASPPISMIAFVSAAVSDPPATRTESDAVEAGATPAPAAPPDERAVIASAPLVPARAAPSDGDEQPHEGEIRFESRDAHVAASPNTPARPAPLRELQPMESHVPDIVAQTPDQAEPPTQASAPHPSASTQPIDRTATVASQPAPAASSHAMLTIVEIHRKSPATIEIRLDPPELGVLTVEIARDANGDIRAIVSAERGETLSLARRHVDILARELTEVGDQRAHIDFRDDGGQRRDDTERRPQRFQFASVDREANSAFNTTFAALSGGVDIIA